VRIIETSLQKFRNKLTKRSRTDYIVLHHADWPKCSVYDIHRSHLARGWAGIGYAYFVSKDGQIYRGRPHDAVGAHCEGYNSVSLGICAEGDYEDEWQMPSEQKNAIIALLVELKKVYPQAQIVGHRDLIATSCPGKNYPFNEILQAVKTKQQIEEGTKVAERWKVNIIQKGKDLELLNQDHDPDDVAAKWFAVELAIRLKEEISEVKETLNKIREALS